MPVLGLTLPRASFDRPNNEIVALNPDWALQRGLTYFIDDRTGRNLVEQTSPTFTGTVRRAVGYPLNGMTRGYGSTFGAGTTDVLSTPVLFSGALDTGVATIAAWVNENGTGGAANGSVFAVATAAGLIMWQVRINTTSLRFARGHATTNAVWDLAITTGEWALMVGVIQDDGSDAGTLYKNGILATTVTHVTGVGLLNTTAANALVGNRASGANNWDGMIGPVMMWNRLLTAADVWSLYDPTTRWDCYAQPSTAVYFMLRRPTLYYARQRQQAI